LHFGRAAATAAAAAAALLGYRITSCCCCFMPLHFCKKRFASFQQLKRLLYAFVPQ
jgi:hypothetical protein